MQLNDLILVSVDDHVCEPPDLGTGMNLRDPSAPVEIMITGTPITLFGAVNGKGGKRPSDYAAGYATIGDVVQQMAGAFAVAFQRALKRAQRTARGTP